MRRTREEAEQTKEAIFQAALRLLTENGIGETSMSAIAREAGVTRGAIYWHFESKDALLQEIGNRLHLFYSSLVDKCTDGFAPVAERIGDAVRYILSKYRDDPEYRRLQDLHIKINIMHGGDLEATRNLIRKQERALERFAPLISSECDGEALCARDIFVFTESLVGGLLIRQFFRNQTMSDEEIESAACFMSSAISTYLTTHGSGAARRSS